MTNKKFTIDLKPLAMPTFVVAGTSLNQLGATQVVVELPDPELPQLESRTPATALQTRQTPALEFVMPEAAPIVPAAAAQSRVPASGAPYAAIESTAQRIAQRVEFPYQWYVQEHEATAQQFMEALELAYKMQLAAQIKRYRTDLIALAHKDMATRFHQKAVRNLGYDGSLKIEHYPQARNTKFRVLIEQTWNKKTEWVMIPAAKFQEQIPLHALRAWEAFEHEQYQPESYWVADKIETIVVPRRVDPILLARFGAYFAAIAWWL